MKTKLNWLKEKVTNNWSKVLGAVLWIYLFVRFEGVRDFFITLTKCLLAFWAFAVVLVICMCIFALLAFLVMVLAVKLGVLPKDYLTVKLNKIRKERKTETQ